MSGGKAVPGGEDHAQRQGAQHHENPTPQSFQVVWEETTIDKAKATKDSPILARLPWAAINRTRADAERNNLGLCVTAYDIRGQSS